MTELFSAPRWAAALLTSGFLIVNSGSAFAAETMTDSHMMMAPKTAVLNGVISGGKGVALNCGGTTAEVHDPSTGKVVATGPTTPTGGGACAFAIKVPAGIALSSCAGKVSLAQASEMGARSSMSFMSTDRSMVNGHERIGTLGSSHIFSTVASVSSLSPGGSSAATITVGAEP